MVTAASHLTMKTYQCLVEAMAVQHRLGCQSTDQAADVVRRTLIAHLGLRRFLGYRMNSHTNSPAGGWIVEFDHGRRQILLDQTEHTLVEAVEQVLESNVYRDLGMWPTGVRRGDVYVEL
jgi:hypothetical protein